MDARTTEKQFEENLRLFGTPSDAHPEQFNLYGGLANLAKELQAIRSEVSALRQAVERMAR